LPAGTCWNSLAAKRREWKGSVSSCAGSGLLLFLILAILSRVSAQVYSQPGGVSPGKYTLSGTVINTATGEGVPHALVQVLDRAQLTGAEGEFRFEGLPSAELMPVAHKPGFFNSEERSSRSGGPGSQDKLVKLGPDTRPIIIKLQPEGVISGSVTGSEGEPVEGVMLQLHHQQVVNGRREWAVEGPGKSNEDGEFRIANLLPGTYFLSARPEPKRVVRGTRPSRVEEGYASMFYSGAPDLTSAAPIAVQAGGNAQVNLSLRSEPTFRVAGTISGYAPGLGVNLQFTTPGGDEVPIDINLDPPTGSFEARMVPAGTYTVRATAFVPAKGAPQRLLAELPLQVRSNVNNVHLVLQPAPAIPVVVREEFVKSQEQPGFTTVPPGMRGAQMVSVRLFSLGRPNFEVYSRFEGPPENFRLVLADAEPGKYRVEITPNGGPWYVASAQFGETDLSREDLVIYPGASQPLEVVVRDDPASLDVTVQLGESDEQALVLIVPDRRISPAQQGYFRRGGVARFNGLAPGDYRIYAFDDVAGLEYMNPEAMRDYFPKSARITLHANDNASVHLDLIRRGGE